VIDLTATEEWAALRRHHEELAPRHLRQLFATDPERATRLTGTVADLFVDYSKHRATEETLQLLVALAARAGLENRIAAMFAGERINRTENRSVLHVALRMPPDRQLVVDGVDVVAEVHDVLSRMSDLAGRIRDGRFRGYSGHPIRTVVNIGIGGSDLGPAMAVVALRAFGAGGPEVRCVSNIDPAALQSALRGLTPAETLFVVSSKTFTTLETLTNARAAREWLLAGAGHNDAAIARHFVAVSTNTEEVRKFGIDPANMLGFWDWVGGRYSVDSAIGFSLMCAIGPERFRQFLDGFHRVDEHFRTTPLRENLPVLLGLLNVWYRVFFGAESHAVLPYAERLARFPAYLQQLTMESNGKSVREDGTPVEMPTGEIFWGEPGTNGQHAFYQLLHQGTTLVPADFIAFVEPESDLDHQHDLLVANCLAQSAALAFGRTAEEVMAEGTPAALVPHKVMPGNRPSTTIVAPRLDPSTLGQLIALYEHIVFTEGTIFGIDSFDQWGVELGKQMAADLAPALLDDAPRHLETDSSTANLVRHYRQLRGRAV